MGRIRLLGAIVLAASLSACTSEVGAAGGGSLRVSRSPSFERDLEPSARHTWVFEVENAGDGEAHLGVRKSSCSCYGVDLERSVVGPRERTTVSVVMPTPAYGDVSGWVLLADEKGDGELLLRMGGRVGLRAGLSVAPTAVYLAAGEGMLTATVDAYPRGGEPSELSELGAPESWTVSATPASVELSMEQGWTPTENGGRRARMRLSVAESDWKGSALDVAVTVHAGRGYTAELELKRW